MTAVVITAEIIKALWAEYRVARADIENLLQNEDTAAKFWKLHNKITLLLLDHKELEKVLAKEKKTQ